MSADHHLAASIALVAFFVGCAGGSRGSDAPAAAIPWEQQTRSQRMQYMREVVLPETKKLFVAFDSDRFADFGCPTCHGDDMQKVGFKMPNKLPALPGADTLAKAREHDAKITEFMEKQLLPKMAELLDEPITPSEDAPGFSCFECHPRQ